MFYYPLSSLLIECLILSIVEREDSYGYSQEFQGRNRKYYSITDSGKEQLIFLKKEWNEYYHTIDDIIEGRMIPDGK